jgi:hypothetical protein
MRLTLLVLGCAVYLAADRAAATSCLILPWDHEVGSVLLGDTFQDGYTEPVAVPLDAAPWRALHCYEAEVPPLSACEVVHGDDAEGPAIAATVEVIGDEACALAGSYHKYLVRVVPAAPLSPGAPYFVRCADDRFLGGFTVRDDGTPAAPPSALAVVDVHYTRGDDGGCCGRSGDVLELRIADTEAAYLREGGYIEVVYADGQHLAVVQPQNGEFYELPPTRDPITLTPVAADGVRGEVVVLADFAADRVYLACDVDQGRAPLALWLLAPLVWISAHGRRRRAV